MSKHFTCGSDGIDLHFETDQEYEDYKKDRLLLDLKHYLRLRSKYGIYAGNQSKYVTSAEQLNVWDSKVMENLLTKHWDEVEK